MANNQLPIVGLGASAGGLEALKSFFSAVHKDSGMAYVVVVHLSPDQPSAMADILSRGAQIPVEAAQDDAALEPNKAYVAPPGKDISIYQGKIQLFAPEDTGPTFRIDPFLRSLADDQGPRAAAVILSGTGSDGALGIKEIKAKDGLVLVQVRESAAHGGMPSAALATGVVDLEAKPEEMPTLLQSHFSRSLTETKEEAAKPDEEQERWLGKIFGIIRSKLGHDFSGYKRSTIVRRAQRRMALQQIEDQEAYIRLLRGNPKEVETLFREFLIGVTHFFRDEEAFKTLQDQGIASLVDDLAGGDTVRAWVPGCSTGEEAYTVAMIIREAIDRRPGMRLNMQVFGTDIDSWAIQKARAGLFPESIAADVERPRLDRFFVREREGYRLRKEIRESVIFSVQNVLKDPPFSRLHLLCCRNLLIYLESDPQKKLIRLFHYTLQKNGILMLGSSENIGGLDRLFATVDGMWKIYRRKEVDPRVRGPLDLPAGGIPDQPEHRNVGTKPTGRREPAASVMRQELLMHFAPVAVLTEEDGSIIHVHGRTGRFLEAVTGPVTHNVLDLARQGLRLELSTAMRNAEGSVEPVYRRGIRLRSGDESMVVDVAVKRVQEGTEGPRRFLIAFFERADIEVQTSDAAGDAAEPGDEREDRIAELEQELKETRSSHQSTIEQLESANEELRSTNEEMQSSNEELQSTNEELESSKEELQSLNEELNTVNSELQSKLDELAAANDDMRNLLNSTDVITIFVDGDLCIRRFTDTAKEIINVIQSDVGRPLRHVVSNIKDGDLAAHAEQVVDKLIPVDREVQTEEGKWYEMRIVPYRTTDNRVDGAVMTFVDIDERKKAMDVLEGVDQERKSTLELAESIINLNPQPLLVLDEDGVVTVANDAAVRMLHRPSQSIIGRKLFDDLADARGAASLEEKLSESVSRISEFYGEEMTIGSGAERRRFQVTGRIVPRIGGLAFRLLLAFDEMEKSEDSHE